MLNVNLKIDKDKYPKLYKLMMDAVNRPRALEFALEEERPGLAYWDWGYDIHDWRCSNCGCIHPARGPAEVSGITCPECGSLMIGSFIRRERDGDYEDR